MTMKFFQIEVTGMSPYLMHRFTEAAEQPGGTRRIEIQKELPRDAAERVAYRTDKKELYMPGPAFMRLLREVGGGHKQRGSRKSLKYVIPAACLVCDEIALLRDPETWKPLKDFEVDSRPVTIPATKGKVMRHRPRLERWGVRFTLRVNDAILSDDVVHTLLNEGGQTTGVGDFRPEKGGPFGTFRVTKWEPTEQLATAAE